MEDFEGTSKRGKERNKMLVRIGDKEIHEGKVGKNYDREINERKENKKINVAFFYKDFLGQGKKKEEKKGISWWSTRQEKYMKEKKERIMIDRDKWIKGKKINVDLKLFWKKIRKRKKNYRVREKKNLWRKRKKEQW